MDATFTQYRFSAFRQSSGRTSTPLEIDWILWQRQSRVWEEVMQAKWDSNEGLKFL
jgi:hypothetical protein